MAQLDPSRRHLEASKSQGTESSPNIKAPRSQTSPTFQQLIQGEASVWSPASSPKLRKNNDHEEDTHNKKSVLMKVKERARKLRHSLSGKKQHNDHHLSRDNSTPSWGVRLEDYEEEEEDPEYLGAPMYESELAPENYKESARQHPRELHGMPSEKHVIKKEAEDPEYLGAPMYESELAPENYKETARHHPREVHGLPSEKHVIKKEAEHPEYLGAPMYGSELAPENYKETARHHPREVHGLPSEKHVIEKEAEHPEYLGTPMYRSELAPQNYKETARHHPRDVHGMPSEKQVIKKEAEHPEYLGAPMYESELAPENYNEIGRQHPREVHGLPSEKHVTRSVKQEEEEEEQYHSPKQGIEEHSNSNPKKSITESMSDRVGPTYASMSEKLAPAYAALFDATQNVANKIASLTISTPETGAGNTRSPQTRDKGVSVKEYLMQKFEPGEDEKALSEVISEKISPRRTPGDAGMVEKVKGAVSSFLWTEESSQETSQSTKSTQNASNANQSSPSLLSTKKSTNKSSTISHTSHSPTMRASSLPHTHGPTTNLTKPANNKRSLSAHAPISTTASSTTTNEVNGEENHGRILQAN